MDYEEQSIQFLTKEDIINENVTIKKELIDDEIEFEENFTYSVGELDEYKKIVKEYNIDIACPEDDHIDESSDFEEYENELSSDEFSEEEDKKSSKIIYNCTKCSKKYSNLTVLKNHMMLHTDVEKVLCKICSKTLSSPSHVTRHMQTHRGQIPGPVRRYPCTQCNMSLTCPESLKRHMVIHTGERKYQCAECQQKFPYRTSLTRHMLIHTNQRPYKCDKCEARFTQTNSLKYHMYTHDNNKSFYCDICCEEFSRGDALKRHQRRKKHLKKLKAKNLKGK